MAAGTYNGNSHQGLSYIGMILLIPLVLIVAGAFASVQLAPIVEAPPEADTLYVPQLGVDVKLGEHAFDNHTVMEVEDTRRCIENGGIRYLFKEWTGSNHHMHMLCQDEYGSWLDMIVKKVWGKWEEVSSFPVKDYTTSWKAVENWIARKTGEYIMRPW